MIHCQMKIKLPEKILKGNPVDGRRGKIHVCQCCIRLGWEGGRGGGRTVTSKRGIKSNNTYRPGRWSRRPII